MTKSEDQRQSVLRLYTIDTNGASVELEATRSRRYPERFWTMFQSTTAFLAGLDRPPCYHRALLALLTVADPVQMRRISAREVAKLARMSANSAERALSMLEADGVIISNGEKTVQKAIRLSNSLVWMARADRHAEAMPDPAPVDARGR